MNKGWIKLHRKILDNPFLYKDGTARYVFITLLLLVDRETGEWSGGRKQLAGHCRFNEKTVYSAISRLKRQHVISTSSAGSWTTFSICKWHEYQQADQHDVSTATPIRQHSNKKEKKKENKTNNSTNVLTTKVVDKRNPELQELIDYAKTLNFPLQGTQRVNRNMAHHCLKKFGLSNSKRLIDAAVKSRGQPFSPTINDFNQLYKKAADLATFFAKGERKQNNVEII